MNHLVLISAPDDGLGSALPTGSIVTPGTVVIAGNWFPVADGTLIRRTWTDTLGLGNRYELTSPDGRTWIIPPEDIAGNAHGAAAIFQHPSYVDITEGQVRLSPNTFDALKAFGFIRDDAPPPEVADKRPDGGSTIVDKAVGAISGIAMVGVLGFLAITFFNKRRRGGGA